MFFSTSHHCRYQGRGEEGIHPCSPIWAFSREVFSCPQAGSSASHVVVLKWVGWSQGEVWEWDPWEQDFAPITLKPWAGWAILLLHASAGRSRSGSGSSDMQRKCIEKLQEWSDLRLKVLCKGNTIHLLVCSRTAQAKAAPSHEGVWCQRLP